MKADNCTDRGGDNCPDSTNERNTRLEAAVATGAFASCSARAGPPGMFIRPRRMTCHDRMLSRTDTLGLHAIKGARLEPGTILHFDRYRVYCGRRAPRSKDAAKLPPRNGETHVNLGRLSGHSSRSTPSVPRACSRVQCLTAGPGTPKVRP